MTSRLERIRRLFAASQDRGCSTVLLGVVDLAVILYVLDAAEVISHEIRPSETDHTCPEWAFSALCESIAQLKEDV